MLEVASWRYDLRRKHRLHFKADWNRFGVGVRKYY